jgi:hypothetical protein
MASIRTMLRRYILAAAAVALILAPVGFATAQRAPAPAPPPQNNFFNFLFGPFVAPAPPPQPIRPRATTPQVAVPAAPAKPLVSKDPQARKVVVVGDFVGAVVAAGLDRAFADEPRIRVIDRTNSNSGLARLDYYDWARALPAILNAERPDLVVTVLGANDRQQLTGTGAAAWGTPEWDAAYGDRVAAVAAVLTQYAAPFFWMGTVPMRSTPEPDMAHINDLVRPRLEAATGHFVDVWDGFADENDRLVISGPDVDGQIRPLRTANGINFTEAGQAKLAFYIAREIRRETGIGAGAVNLVASLSQASRIEIGPDGKGRLVGPVISLTEPAPASAVSLTGDAKALNAPPLLAAPKDATSPQALLIQGAPLPVVRGRADDFSWPKPGP